MELPFKYMVLCIIKKLNDRGMPLVINKSNLLNYFAEFMKKSYFTIEEKQEIKESFDFDYELDDLFDKYYTYFELDGDKIIFDEEYSLDIANLIQEEKKEYEDYLIHDIDFVIDGNTSFLDIIGIKVNKDLYNYLLNMDKELEGYYDEFSDLENYVGLAEVDTSNLINKIKKLSLKRMVMLVNAKNLLSSFEHYDLMNYARNIAENEDLLDEIDLLIEDDNFDMSDIINDVFLRSIFLGSESYISNLKEKLIVNTFDMNTDMKYSRIKFYLTFLELLEREKGKYNDILDTEFVRIKYRIMNVMDSVYDTTLFMGNGRSVFDGIEFKERYYFVQTAVYYFIRELLMYDDEKYKNVEHDVDNTLVYLNNIMKKLLIETYYKLTLEEQVINEIKGNSLYGVNTISSGFLKNIVDKPKGRVREK